ncbi:IS630 family transposase [Streptomyces aureus]
MRCPTLPLRPRHAYAAGIQRGLPTDDFNRPRSHPTPHLGERNVHRNPAHIRQIRAGGSLKGLYTPVPHVHLSVSLAGPAPSGSASASRRCRGCFPPLPAPPGSNCPQLRRAAATARRRSPFTSARSHSASWRTKTQIQALDRTQPVLPVSFAASEQRTADYVRHGTTNLFAALNVTTGEVLGECKPTRNGKDFLAFLKKAVKPHAGKDIHVVLDNLSTHTTPEVKEWLVKNPHVHFHFTPVGSSWLNQIEIWFGILTRQSIRRGTFSSVNVLIKQIRDYINSWNTTAKPFTWTATSGEVLAKVRLTATNVKKLVNNNSN